MASLIKYSSQPSGLGFNSGPPPALGSATFELSLEVLRNELEAQFESFSKDFLPSMKNLFDESLKNHVRVLESQQQRFDFRSTQFSSTPSLGSEFVSMPSEYLEGRDESGAHYSAGAGLTRLVKRKSHLGMGHAHVIKHHIPQYDAGTTRRLSWFAKPDASKEKAKGSEESSRMHSRADDTYTFLSVPLDTEDKPNESHHVRFVSEKEEASMVEEDNEPSTNTQTRLSDSFSGTARPRYSHKDLRRSVTKDVQGGDHHESTTSEEDENEHWLWRFVKNKKFDYLSCLVLALNAIMLGIQTDYCARNWSDSVPRAFVILNRAFCLVFVLEISLRIAAFGPGMFFTGPQWEYNTFDAFVVSLQVAEESIDLFFTVAGAKMPRYANSLRLLRYFRLLRVMRLSRAMFFLVSIRVLVVSIIASLRSLVWVMALIALQTFVASIPLTQLATDYKLQNSGSELDKEIEKYYGTMDRTMLALYEMLAEGLHWDDMMRPLVQHTSPWVIVFFVLYSAFAIFAMMNVVTGVFVDSALMTAEESRKHSLLQTMKEVFMGTAGEMKDSISLEMFEDAMMQPSMAAFLKGIDLIPSDASQLFYLLDEDDSGEIDAEELMVGCARLQGGAKALDLASLMFQFAKQTRIWDKQFALIDTSLSILMRDASARRHAVEHHMREASNILLREAEASAPSADLA